MDLCSFWCIRQEKTRVESDSYKGYESRHERVPLVPTAV